MEKAKTRTLALRLAGVSACVVAGMGVAAGTAAAGTSAAVNTKAAAATPRTVHPNITPLPCDAATISFKRPDGSWRCYGGSVGSTDTDFTALYMNSGIYYGNITVTSDTGCYFIPFKKYEKVTMPGTPGYAVVNNITITPPF